jgi:GH15 family glucan-1,4-alpha-glucosidase
LVSEYTVPAIWTCSTLKLMAYQPIEDYGIVGNLRTAALIGKNGSVDWLCFPRFDSPSVFGGILDSQKGGFFRIAPSAGDVTHKQLYWPDTNVLVTRFLSNDGVGEIIDFMPMRENYGLIRQVKSFGALFVSGWSAGLPSTMHAIRTGP